MSTRIGDLLERDTETDENEPIDRSPASFSGRFAVFVSMVAVFSLLFGMVWGILPGLFGVAMLWWGAYSGSRFRISVGTLFLFLGVLLSAAGEPSPAFPLAGTAATIVAWDLAQNAISVGEQLGSETNTTTAEAFHAAGTLATGLLGAVGGFVVYQVAWGGQPVFGVMLLVVGTMLLLFTMRD
ncbi:MAG: hypothetical protein ABEJ08_02845 [Halobacteriaceae archaeon]